MTENEVVVTIDGRPRPATVVERGPERTLVRFRDAGSYREEWVSNADLVAVEPGRDRSTLYKLLGLVVLGALGLSLLLIDTGGSNKPLSEVLPTATTSATATSTPSPASTTSPPAAVRRAVFFGDSFVAGRGLQKGQLTAVQVAAKQLGWDATLLPGDGSGFTTGGTRGSHPYSARLKALTTAPTVLVLQGGAADTSASAAALTAAADAVLKDLATRFPSTRVVMLGPVAMEQPQDGQLVRVDGTLREVAAAHHVTYLDPIALRWINPSNAPGFTAATGFYPNAAGHAFLGHKIAAALAALRLQA